MDIGFGEALLIIPGLLPVHGGGAVGADARHGAIGVGASLWVLGIGPPRSTDVISVDVRDEGVLAADRAGADPDPDRRRPDRRPASCCTGHWGPTARALDPRDAGDAGSCSRSPLKLLFPDFTWAEAFLLGAVLSSDRPRRHVDGGDRSQGGAREDPPHAQPRVGAQRRARAALRPLLPRPRLALSATRDRRPFELLGEAGFGAVLGVALGVGGGRLHHALPGGRDQPAATRASTRSASGCRPTGSPT